MNILRQTIKSACRSLLPKSLFLTHGNRSSNQIALTFDDGPDPEQTPRLLDLLQQHNMRVTFFVIGQKVEQHRSLVERMAQEGHELGNHSFTHSEPAITSTTKLLDEVRRTRDLIEEISNRSCTLMRPPKGELTFGKMFKLWQEKQTIALWSVDPKDYQMQSTDEATLWAKAYQPTSGDILLMHDNHPYAYEIVTEIVQQQHSQQFVTLTNSFQ